MPITKDEYRDFREELKGLLEKTFILPELEPDSKQKLGLTKKKLYQDIFSIAFMAEFGSGKSTTFDCFCDGRELSHTGFGIKTSACNISAQNIEDSAEHEYSEIIWKTYPQIVEGFATDQFRARFQELEPERFKEATKDKLVHLLDISTEHDFQLFKKAIAKEWELKEKSEDDYDKGNKNSRADTLRYATIIEKFMENVRERIGTVSKHSPEEVGKMLVFPLDWKEIWRIGKNGINNFQLDQVLFTFIAEAKLHIHSESLSYVGCKIIDCPGFFASEWDKKVAEKAMLSANAIWYIAKLDTSFKQSELEVLKELRTKGMEHKLFFSFNAYKDRDDCNKLLKASRADLIDSKLINEDSELLIYHALLALRSNQGISFIQNRLDEHTLENISRRFRGNTDTPLIDKAKREWQKSANRAYKGFLDLGEEDEGIELTDDSTRTMLDESNFKSILDMIYMKVINDGAESILVNEGSHEIISVLQTEENRLKAEENNAGKEEGRLKNELEESENMLKEFEKKCEKYSKDNDPQDDIGPGLRENFQKKFDNQPALENLKQRLTDKIYDRIKDYGLLDAFNPFGGDSQEAIKRDVRAHISEEFHDYLRTIIAVWFAEIKDGKCHAYNKKISQSIERINEKFKYFWEEATRNITNDTHILKSIEIPEISIDVKTISDDVLNNTPEIDKIMDDLDARMNIIGLIVVLIYNILIGWILNFILSFFNPDSGSVDKGVLKKNISDAVDNVIPQNKEKLTNTISEKFISPLAKNISNKTTEVMDYPKIEFKRSVEKDRRNRDDHKGKMDQLKDKVRTLRENHYEPLRKDIQEFEQRVTDALKNSNSVWRV